MTAVLKAEGLCAGYHGHALVNGLDLEVHSGQVIALLGPNGAGKTTTLLTLAGELPALGGCVLMDGNVAPNSLFRRVRAGLAFVADERSVFTELSVRENLRVGRCNVEVALDLFPELKPMMGRRAGNLSGGEIQMLSMARAISRDPKVILIDELSLGLAPLVVERLLRAVRLAADRGAGVVMVEQQVARALSIADYAYIMRRGQLVLQGNASDFYDKIDLIESSYLGDDLDSANGEKK